MSGGEEEVGDVEADVPMKVAYPSGYKTGRMKPPDEFEVCQALYLVWGYIINNGKVEMYALYGLVLGTANNMIV